MAGTEDATGRCVKCVEDFSAHDGDETVPLDQDEYIEQLRPIRHPELTGADADAKASHMVTDMFVSLRGALAYALITQAWLMVNVVSLQRVQEPTNVSVRRLGAIARALQACPKDHLSIDDSKG
eukprot:154083-Pyramimonas_sp.AAC.1